MPVISAEGKIAELEAMAANAQLTIDWLWTLNKRLLCARVIPCWISSTKSPEIFVCRASTVCLIKAALQPLAKRKLFHSNNNSVSAVEIIQ